MSGPLTPALSPGERERGPLALSADARREVEELVKRYPKRRAAMLPVLRIIEREHGRVTPEGMKLAAELLEVSPSEVWGVATFYPHFKRESDGKYVIWVCSTLPCALRGCRSTLEALEKKLGVKAGETTKDGKFTLKKAECLASCDTAPVIQVDDDHHEGVTPDKIDALLARYL